MKITERETTIAGNVDDALRVDDFKYVPVRDFSDYRRWYARLLTTLTLLLGEDAIVYAQTDFVSETEGVTFTLFTESLLVRVSATQAASEDSPYTVSVIGRKELESLEVDASDRIDEDRTTAFRWPGLVSISARYKGLDDPVKLHALGYDPQARNSDSLGPIVSLLDGLKADLAR